MVERRAPGHHDAFNSSTIHTDSNANTLSDRTVLLLQSVSNAKPLVRPRITFPIHPAPIPQPESNNWLIVSHQDHVTRRSNETETFI